MTVWAIVVAAGAGTRFGGAKQFAPLGGRRVLDWSMAAAAASCDGVVLVVPPGTEHGSQDEMPGTVIVSGGATRPASVRAGLAGIPRDTDIAVVHDAVRPLAPGSLFAAVISAVRSGADGAVPGLAPTDTIKRTAGERVVATLDRSSLVAVQTPQAFVVSALRLAHRGEPEATDDAALVEASGGRVEVVAGDPRNIKVTTPDDLTVAEALLSGRPPVPSALRVGLGFDVHPFSDDGRPLILGGVAFPGQRGLAGHSDADVVAHAVADALLGAAGLGDLGQHFPDTDEEWRGARGLDLLTRVTAMVHDTGLRPTNVDCTVVLEAPRLAPHRAELERRLASAIGAPVSVKATRAEGLGALGRGEGVACWAVAQLRAP
ncbi:MAG TPA: 2-C-methyl-D-erythritol 4-phosphate cytidylyltransferase [Acidimicrobiales bacterium]|nr:2-C-methyl-D-erythritol 4-phosphate cytidylyltransferase [Acidimicrobiales bacterium]